MFLCFSDGSPEKKIKVNSGVFLCFISIMPQVVIVKCYQMIVFNNFSYIGSLDGNPKNELHTVTFLMKDVVCVFKKKNSL